MNVVFLVMWVVSIAFSAVIGLAAITYIRRTWQQIRAEADGSAHDRLLDGIDHLENQMHLVAERLSSLERQLAELDGRLPAAPERPPLPGVNPDASRAEETTP